MIRLRGGHAVVTFIKGMCRVWSEYKLVLASEASFGVCQESSESCERSERSREFREFREGRIHQRDPEAIVLKTELRERDKAFAEGTPHLNDHNNRPAQGEENWNNNERKM